MPQLEETVEIGVLLEDLKTEMDTVGEIADNKEKEEEQLKEYIKIEIETGNEERINFSPNDKVVHLCLLFSPFTV